MFIRSQIISTDGETETQRSRTFVPHDMASQFRFGGFCFKVEYFLVLPVACLFFSGWGEVGSFLGRGVGGALTGGQKQHSRRVP